MAVLLMAVGKNVYKKNGTFFTTPVVNCTVINKRALFAASLIPNEIIFIDAHNCDCGQLHHIRADPVSRFKRLPTTTTNIEIISYGMELHMI